MAREEPTNFLLIGNPGSGKSTILNGLIGKQSGKALFRSGLSYGKGMTYQLDRHQVGPHTYMDTPGLADTKLREAAAKAIEEALKCGKGNYKIFFVMTLQNGRVKAEDVATMKLVLNAAPSISNYGVIINQVPSKEFKDLTTNPRNASPPPLESVMSSLMTGMDQDRFSLLCHLWQRDPDLEGVEDAQHELPPDLLDFIHALHGMSIDPKSVQAIKSTEFDAVQEQMEKMMGEMRAQNLSLKESLEQSKADMARLQQQHAEQQVNMMQLAAQRADSGGPSCPPYPHVPCTIS